MSKPLPPASGFPVKMVVRGADGRDAEAFQLGQVVQGELGRFVFAARQKLDGLDVGGAVKVVTGGSARFFKNNGQEHLVLVLQPTDTATRAAPRQPKIDQSPDFCVVDVAVPGESDLEVRFLAVALDPDTYAGQRFRDEWEFDFDEVGAYSTGREPGEILMQYSRHALSAATPLNITMRVSSLKFDLRQIPLGEVVRVEIWGRFFPEEEDPSDREPLKEFETPATRLERRTGVAYKHNDGSNWHWPDGTGEAHDGDVIDSLGNPTRFNLAGLGTFGPDAALSVPNLLFAQMFDTWIDEGAWDETVYTPAPNVGYRQKRFDPDTGLVLAERRFVHAGSVSIVGGQTCPQHGVASLRSTWTLEFFEQTRLWPAPAPEEDAEERIVDIVSAFYWGDPGLEGVDTLHEDGAGIWAVGGRVPERQKIGEASLPGEDTPESVEFTGESGALTKLGTIIIDRGSTAVSFEPA